MSLLMSIHNMNVRGTTGGREMQRDLVYALSLRTLKSDFYKVAGFPLRPRDKLEAE